MEMLPLKNDHQPTPPTRALLLNKHAGIHNVCRSFKCLHTKVHVLLKKVHRCGAPPVFSYLFPHQTDASACISTEVLTTDSLSTNIPSVFLQKDDSASVLVKSHIHSSKTK